MTRIPLMIALCILISSAPFSTGLALAEPARASDLSAQPTAPSRSPTDTGAATPTVRGDLPPPTRGVESSSPTTPMPMNLPDEAKASEVKGQYAIGMVGLVLGGIVLAALVAAVLFFISRRSWSTTH